MDEIAITILPGEGDQRAQPPPFPCAMPVRLAVCLWLPVRLFLLLILTRMAVSIFVQPSDAPLTSRLVVPGFVVDMH